MIPYSEQFLDRDSFLGLDLLGLIVDNISKCFKVFIQYLKGTRHWIVIYDSPTKWWTRVVRSGSTGIMAFKDKKAIRKNDVFYALGSTYLFTFKIEALNDLGR